MHTDTLTYTLALFHYPAADMVLSACVVLRLFKVLYLLCQFNCK